VSPTYPMPPFAILLGGLATRMGELTRTIPKALLPVADEPFIAHQLRLLQREGVGDVVLCAGHLADQIEAFVGDGSRFGLRVDVSLDGPVLLGTGGALKQALPLLGEEFGVLYGDSYLDTAYGPIVARFRDSGCEGLMTVYRNEGQYDTSNVDFADGMVRRYDKQQTDGMRYIDYGLSLLKSHILRDWPAEGAFDLASVLQALSQRGQLAGFEVAERFYEIGSLSGLQETDTYIRANRARRP
jgi:NDP-sugar pyrophosphorylase family protein